jgi:hypothetical protein
MLRLKDGLIMLINMHGSAFEISFLLGKVLAVIWEISFDHNPLMESILFARPQPKSHHLWGTIRKERDGTAPREKPSHRWMLHIWFRRQYANDIRDCREKGTVTQVDICMKALRSRACADILQSEVGFAVGQCPGGQLHDRAAIDCKNSVGHQCMTQVCTG